jgi:lycopene cyclase domain-containing protein
MKWTYLLVDFCSVIVPFLFSFHPKIRFDKEFRWFFPANLVATLVFLAWDAVFTHIGVWGFNERYITGLRLFNLPLEEILFFICIPFACVFTYHCFNHFWSIKWQPKMEQALVLMLALGLIVTGLANWHRLYTAITFFSTGLVLLALKFAIKVTWLPRLLTIYPVLLLPFFIVNGILTGSGLEAPVVWYNNSENLGIRLFTIPLEDIFYGLEMLVINVFLFEAFRRSRPNRVD